MLKIDTLSKQAAIAVCRRLGLKTGDTGRNKLEYYQSVLNAFEDQQAVEFAIDAYFDGPLMPVVSPVSMAAPVELIAAIPPVAAHPEGIEVVASKTVAEVFGIRVAWAKAMKVDVWNDPAAEVPDPDYKFDPALLRKALIGIQLGSNSWLCGPAGTGKTEFVKNIAARLGRAFYRVSFDAAMERYEYIGGERMRNGSTVFQDGLILQAMTRKGAIVLLDEVDFARPEYTSPLHPVLEPNGRVTITETGRVVQKAAGVVFMAAANSNGTGDATGTYAGVRQMNKAFCDRFGAFIEFQYLKPELEAQVIQLRTPGGASKALADLIVGFLTVCRQSAATSIIESPPGLRQAFALAAFVTAGLPVREAFEVTMVTRLSAENAEQLQQLFKQNVDEAAWAAAAGQSPDVAEVVEAEVVA